MKKRKLMLRNLFQDPHPTGNLNSQGLSESGPPPFFFPPKK